MSTQNTTVALTTAVFALVNYTGTVDNKHLQSVIITDVGAVLGLEKAIRDLAFEKVANGWVIKLSVLEWARRTSII